MKNFFKGFIVGIGKIIPGVSGAMLAISLGIYDKSIDYICNFKSRKLESFRFLFPICVGIIISIVFFSKIISFCLANFYFITMLFFIGLIIGGIPSVYGEVKKNNFYISIISFIFFFLISISSINNVYVSDGSFTDYFIYFFSGIVEAIGTVVPGVSGTALLMIMGTYDTVITSIGNLNNFNVIIPFVIGFVFGLIITVRIINYLFNKCKDKVFAFVFGVLLSSCILLMLKSFYNAVNLFEIFIGILFMIFGLFISNITFDKK